MTQLSSEEIEYVARLARIDLPTSESEATAKDMSSILEFVDSLQAVDTNEVEPTSQVTGLTDVWRDDEVRDCEVSREELLANAPQTQDGYVKVKKVL